jgi:hypothetical protein
MSCATVQSLEDIRLLPRFTIRCERDRTRAQIWLSGHLHIKTGIDISRGVTVPPLRAARIRQLIRERALADRPIGYTDGKRETYRQFITRACGIDLEFPQEPLL